MQSLHISYIHVHVCTLDILLFPFTDKYETEPKRRRVEVDFGITSGVSTKVI